MGRRFSIPLAILLAVWLLLGGCSDPGPLPEGRWFLPYYPNEGPHLWIGRTKGEEIGRAHV